MEHCRYKGVDECYEPARWNMKARMVMPDGTDANTNEVQVCGTHRVAFLQNLDSLKDALERAGYTVGVETEMELC